MNPFAFLTILQSTKKKVKRRRSDRDNERLIKEIKKSLYNDISSFLFIFVGIISTAFGLNSFLVPNGFISGGILGISLLTETITSYRLSILIVLINAPLIIVSYFQVGKNYVVKSVIAVVGLAIAVEYINYPIITADKLLAAVLGGIFVGVGIGFSVRGGCVLDPLEILVLNLSRKTRPTPGNLLLVFNLILFSVALYFLSVEVALFAIFTYLVASKAVNFVIRGIREYYVVTVISNRIQDIKAIIANKKGRNITFYQGKLEIGRKRTDQNKGDIVFFVITKPELIRLRPKIKKIDPDAFIITSSVKDLKGGMIEKEILGRRMEVN